MPDTNLLVKESSLTSVADAIRSKSGTQGNLSFPSGFVSTVESIPNTGWTQGLVNKLKNITFVSAGNVDPARYTLPEELELISLPDFDVSNNDAVLTIGMGNGWADNGVRKITITATPGRKINVNTAFGNQMHLTEITFTNNLITSGDFASVCANCSNLVKFNGIIDCSNSWVNNPFSSCPKLEEVRFAENCIGQHSPNSLSMTSAVLSDESLISIANGLCEGAAKTLSLNSTRKTDCDAIMGTVTMDEYETYHIFTADLNGNTSLTDFITNIKGWTLA